MLSIVIPVFNEAPSLRPLCEEIFDVAGSHALELELIFVDDGSQDGSWQVIEQLAAAEPRVRGLRLRRNFGKAAALSAGFAEAHGELVMTLDADLQDNPREIPAFLEKLEADGLDVVSGWKRIRHDPWHKVLPSRVFNWLVSHLTGVYLHDHNCGMKCYRAEIFREVRLYGELHRFVPVLAAARGFRVGEVEVQHRPRKFGRSKYGIERFVKGFLDLLTVKFLTGFGQRPQHFLGGVGLLFFALGVIGLTYLAALWVVSRLTEMPDVHLHERPALMYSFAALIFGGQLMSLGAVAELFIAYQGRDADTYSIAERTESPTPTPTARQLPDE